MLPQICFIKKSPVLLLSFAVLLLISAPIAVAQSTAFTYQGKLVDNGNLANTSYDMQFKLFDAPSGGTQIAALTFDGIGTNPPAVSVTNGIFAVTLDFGTCSPASPCFNGSARFLEIAVKPHGSGTYTTLSPRQPITATPYAMKTSNLTFNGAYNDVTAVFTASNTFAGDGAGLNTTPNPDPLNSIGKLNSFYGAGAGQANTSGNSNAFFGFLAGQANTTGGNNAFFGTQAGQSNTGNSNAFFGNQAGFSNTSGNNNAFFGRQAGYSNTTGGSNAFFGILAGLANTTGQINAFFGYQAGFNNATGNGNAFFGARAGNGTTTGSNNAFFGIDAGFSNATGLRNTFIGTFADFNDGNTTGNNNTLLGSSSLVTANLDNATAVGANASVTQSNSLVLGGITGVNGGTSVNVGIGTTAPQAKLEIAGSAAGAIRLNPNDASFGGIMIGSNSDGFELNLVGGVPDGLNMGGRIRLGGPARGDTEVNAIQFIQNESEVMRINNGGNVGIGTISPADKLHVFGDVRVGTSGTNGCLKNNNGGTIVGTCSSDARFKRDITPFPNLLSRFSQLQPVYFHWRSSDYPERHFGQAQETGLIAQEVEKVLPELVTEDEQGYKAVNYSKLPLLTLQAVKELKAENDSLKQKLTEQQSLNSSQQQQIQNQQQEIQAIKQLLCQSQPQADLCKGKTSK